MKTVKIIISAIFTACILAVSLSPAAGAVSINAGLDQLRSQWSRATGPESDGLGIEYSYYIPETENECPLVVLLGGAGEGTPSGNELKANEFAYWSSEEYQAMVPDAGGLYIQILKAPEPVYFDTCPLAPMFGAIKDFAEHHNIDKRRIFLGGWCIGASGVSRLATAHPDYFSGIMLFSPRTVITKSEAAKIKHMKAWIFASKGDTYSNYATFALPCWENLKDAVPDKTQVRLTSSTTCPRAALLMSHYTWLVAEQDFAPGVQAKYTGLKTVDGNENTVASPEIFGFMAALKEGETARTVSGTEEESSGEETSEEESQAESVTDVTAPYKEETLSETTAPESETIDKPADNVKIKEFPVAAVCGGAAAAAAVCAAAIILIKKRRK